MEINGWATVSSVLGTFEDNLKSGDGCFFCVCREMVVDMGGHLEEKSILGLKIQ